MSRKGMETRYGGQKRFPLVPQAPHQVVVPEPPPPQSPPPPRPPRPRNVIIDRAIFWICSGENYLREARLSACSVAAHMPSLPRILYTPDAGVEAGDEFDELRRLPPRIHPDQWFLESTRYLRLVLPELPEFLVWATVDTYCCHEFGFIFDFLKGCDWASTPMPANTSSGETIPDVPASFQEPTICVMALRNSPRLEAFASAWYAHYKEHKQFYSGDQTALRAALWMERETICYRALPKGWLSILAITNDLDGPAYWLHGRPGVDFTYQRPGLLAKWAEEVNRTYAKRTWRAR